MQPVWDCPPSLAGAFGDWIWNLYEKSIQMWKIPCNSLFLERRNIWNLCNMGLWTRVEATELTFHTVSSTLVPSGFFQLKTPMCTFNKHVSNPVHFSFFLGISLFQLHLLWHYFLSFFTQVATLSASLYSIMSFLLHSGKHHLQETFTVLFLY